MSDTQHTTYTAAQMDENYPAGVENLFWNVARNKIIASTLKKLNVNTPILDIGCGRGVVTAYLDKEGFQIQGVEPSSIPNPHIRPNLVSYGLKLEEIPKEQRSEIKTVLLLDVVEHIEDVSDFLENLVSCLDNLEIILFTIPARNEIWSNYDEHFGHFRRYTPSMMDSVAAKIGGKIVYQRYFFHSLYWVMLLFTCLKWDRNTQIKVPKGNYQRIFHKTVGQIMAFERFVVPRNFIGSSLISVMKIGN